MSDLDFDLSRSLKVTCNGAVGFSIYESHKVIAIKPWRGLIKDSHPYLRVTNSSA